MIVGMVIIALIKRKGGGKGGEGVDEDQGKRGIRM